MVEVIIVVRETGRLKAEFWHRFELPEVPRIGDYISVHSPDVREPLGEI